MTMVRFQINGKSVGVDVPPNALLVDVIRRDLGLTGTHVGCDTSQCGACVIHMNGRSVKACAVLAAQVDGANITTIEGLSKGTDLHPVQSAFKEAHGLQCGFCTPGMIMAAADLLQHNPDPSESEIRAWLKGNICRCTGYHNIVKAIQIAAADMRSARAAA